MVAPLAISQNSQCTKDMQISYWSIHPLIHPYIHLSTHHIFSVMWKWRICSLQSAQKYLQLLFELSVIMTFIRRSLTWKREMDFFKFLFKCYSTNFNGRSCDTCNGPDSPLKPFSDYSETPEWHCFSILKCFCKVKKNTVFQWIKLCLKTKPGQRTKIVRVGVWGVGFLQHLQQRMQLEKGAGKKTPKKTHPHPSLISARLHIYFCSKD